MSETTLWGASLPEVQEQPALLPAPEQSINPCVNLYGKGPEGRICQDCIHLHGFRQSATWWKCSKRQWRTKGGKYPGTVYPGKDHRVRYPVCALFKERHELASQED